MRFSRPIVACALSLALAAGTASAQQTQWRSPDQFERQQQQQWGQQQFRGFEQDQDRWRTTTQIPQLRGTNTTLAQSGQERDTFVRIENGQVVSAYVDGRLVSPRDVQVRGDRIRVLDRDGEPAAIFRIPRPGQMMGVPEPFDRDFQPGMQQPWQRPGMMPGQQRFLGTPQAPVADLRTSAVGILMLEAHPQHLRGTHFDRGVRIDAVQEGMPAHRAGLRRGDIIVAVEGREGVSPERLKSFLRSVPPGERLTFTIVRNGEEREINVRTTGMLPAKVNWDYMQTGLDDRQLREQQMMLDRQRQLRGFREGRIFGIGLTDADEEDLQDLDEYEEGLHVRYVNPGTVLHHAGIRRGDIIVAVEGQSDITRNDLREILQDKEPGDHVRMLVLRDNRLHTVHVPVGRNHWE